MSVAKEARRDAREFARAEMFYGEGAGTRRKLITATVESKAHKSEEYAREFHKELARQDMAEHAAKARRERERKDRTHDVNRNVRGVLSGNYQSVNTGVMVAIAAVYVAHQTGLDKKAIEKGRELIHKFKSRRHFKKHKIHLITDLGTYKTDR